ncbi:MAG: type II secretion system F family protein, partial [Erysipelotrichaceae bacterium]
GSLGHAIYCSAQVALEQNRIKKEMLKKLQYPCLLLLLCCIVCSLFGFVVLPQLHAMQFDTPRYGVIQALQLIQVLVLTTIFLLMGSIVVFLLLSKSDHVGAVECTQRLFGFTVVKQWMTLLFVQHLEAVMQIETSTKNALQILHHHPNKALRKMAAQLEAGLLQGDDYGEVFAKREWVDPMLLRYVTYGLQGDCLPSMLGSYSQMTMALWQRRFLRFGQLMQWIAYGFCAANMIVAYQVLLEPLALLERM